MNYRDQVFIAAAENLSFSKAAEDLFISQPAVTKHIKELENKLNVALFDRKGNRIQLTKAGQLVYKCLKQIQIKYKDLEFELGLLNETFNGTLRIGASSSISQYVIPSYLAAFNQRYPKLKLYLENGNSFEMEQKLLNGKVDIALVENESSNSDLRYLPFMDDEICLVTGANSAYAKRKFISKSDLKILPFILREKGSGTLEVIQKAMQRNGIDFESLNVVINIGSTEAIKNFLIEFEGVALLSEKSVEKELQLKQVSKICIKNLTISRRFRVAFRQGPELKIPKLFNDFLHLHNR